MKKQTLFSILFAIMLTATFTACSSNDDVQVTETGKSNSLLMGKWELVSKQQLDLKGNVITEDLATSHSYPAQITEYHKQGITIQTTFSSQKDKQGNYLNERWPRQWELIGTKLYLGISKNLEQKADQVYKVELLDHGQLVIQRNLDQYDTAKYSSDVSSIRMIYKKVL
ncbi:hypothetical protein LNQ81_12595 [Myroides sp. M-43]|uniref:hypothetical protein n=1 Tax=Myroides oncorhynchi TaxID=2893756 RepID=UPI001E2C0112|nr:hypothetical protein [Myroides oncorhynchi]MCC9043511.1 hypothetical protein [Myroides oncorhynchi]